MTAHNKNKLALVLSCGVALGAAHLGVLKSLFKQGIKPDIYIGSSMGALVAAMMAVYDDIDYVTDRYLDFVRRHNILDLLAFPVLTGKHISSTGGVISGERLMRVIEKESGIAGMKLSDTKKPLYITATDLNSGHEIVFGYPQKLKLKTSPEFKNYYQPIFYLKDIPIIKALRASMGVPVIFKPYPMRMGRQKMALVDGGVRDSCPYRLAAHLPGVKNILASDLGYAGLKKADYFHKDIVSVFFQFIDISTTISQLGQASRDNAFSGRGAPSVRIINPGIYSVYPFAIKRSKSIILSAYHTMQHIFKNFAKQDKLDKAKFWGRWGEKEAKSVDHKRLKVEKLGTVKSNIFSITDRKAPLEAKLKKGLRYKIRKLFA
jgi:predicted acylesterase/phospholipase RssA